MDLNTIMSAIIMGSVLAMCVVMWWLVRIEKKHTKKWLKEYDKKEKSKVLTKRDYELIEGFMDEHKLIEGQGMRWLLAAFLRHIKGKR
jgi:hypothetical protein